MLVRVGNPALPKPERAMFSAADMIIIGALALLLFGPDRLPGLMRQAGRFMREVQNTSSAFVSEMERAADVNEATPGAPPPPESTASRPDDATEK